VCGAQPSANQCLPRAKKSGSPCCVTAPPVMRHHITVLSHHVRSFLKRMGATMENDDMVADYADAALWALFAAAIAFITLGCHMTKPKPKVVPQRSEGGLERVLGPTAVEFAHQ
jgi:hypothetical protein